MDRTYFVLALSLVAAHAQAQATPSAARPINRCQLEGAHVAGVVSVDLQNGSRAELPLVDVEATIAMAPRLENVVFYVTAPLAFSGTYVPGGRGGPAAHAARPYRASGRGLSVAPNVPFEIRLASADDHARVRIPTIFSEGAVEFDVPCSALKAGSPRANMAPEAGMRPELEPTRGTYLEFAPDVVIRASADATSPEVAHLLGADGTRRMKIRGRITPGAGAFVQVQITVGPATIQGYVPRESVVEFGRNLSRPGGASMAYAVQTMLVGPEVETIEATLPHGTQVFATTVVMTPWATLNGPMRVTLRRRAGADTRYALVLGEANVVARDCRVDGVGGYPSCGPTRDMPRLGVFPCAGSSCSSVAFVDGP